MIQTLTLRLTLIRTQTLSPLKNVLSPEELKNGLKRLCKCGGAHARKDKMEN